MWVLSGLLAFVRLQDFTPAGPAPFHQLVTALSMCLAHQAQVSASHTAFLVTVAASSTCLASRLLLVVSKRPMLSSPAVLVDSLFLEEYVTRLLKATRSSSSLKSQQSVVAVACRRSSTSSSFLRRLGSPPRSPRRSPAQRRRPSSASPSRASKRVRFHSPAPSSVLLSPRTSHCGNRGRVPHMALLSLVSSLSFSDSIVPSLGAVTCAWCLCTLAVSPVPHSSLAVPIEHLRVLFLFIVISCLLISHWSLAILHMAPCPFCLRSFLIVLAFPPVVPLSFLIGAPGPHSLCPSFVRCVCPALVPSSFLLPSYLAASSQVVLYPWPFGSS